MSDTPRTDEQAGYYDGIGCWKSRINGEEVPSEFAREIERELSAKIAECAELRGENIGLQAVVDCCMEQFPDCKAIGDLAGYVAELRKDADRYRFWRDHVEPNYIQEMIMLDPADTDKAVDRAIQTWEEDQEKRKAYDHYERDTRYDR